MPGINAPIFEPDVNVVYNQGGTAISAGQAVQWGTAVAHEANEPDWLAEQKIQLTNQSARSAGVTNYVPAIKRADTVATYNSMCGVALFEIPATSYGYIATKGIVDVYVGPSANITVNDFLVVSAAGAFAEGPVIGTATQMHAIALEGVLTSGTCAAAMCRAFIPASGIPGDQCAGGATTA